MSNWCAWMGRGALAWGLVFFIGGAVWGAEAALDDATFFRTRVRPVLSDKCFKCHGPGQQEAELRLDEREAALEGGLLVPGDPENSEVLRRVMSDDEFERMPPPEISHKLTPEQVGILREWIEQGVPYAGHWAYEPIARTAPPVEGTSRWAFNPIDTFVEKQLTARGLRPSLDADRRTLIRRVSLDLVGLLPTPEEVEAFERDPRPDAYERLVDRLLASPHYGERQGRHWLDLARYADSNGYTIDSARTIWPYRDWVVRAINENMPFDQFTIEQLAGDLLESPTESQRVATGFQRNTPFNQEGGTDPEQFRVERTIDRANTIGSVWLGLTVACAQCHDHKFDAISIREYYELYAFFNSVDEVDLPLPTESQKNRIAALRAQLEAAQASPEGLSGREKIEGFLQNGEAVARAWHLLTPEEVSASAGSELAVLEDGSVLASGEIPATDVYTVEVTLPAGKWSALRFEALTHESLPKGGPGRAGNGNFVLSEVGVTSGETAWKFREAVADHSQDKYDVSQALAGDRSSGWAISTKEGNQNVDRVAIFSLAKPIEVAQETRARVRLTFSETPAKYVLGRFRLAVSEAPVEFVSLPVGVQTALLEAGGQEDAAAWGKVLEGVAKIERAERIKRIESQIGQAERRSVKTLALAERGKPRETRIHQRGDFLNLGEVVSPGTLAALPELRPEGEEATRLDLARWLVRADQPLTPRVVVNRYWQRFFGLGLVSTENDFGMQGAFPTHPELLDWLARKFVESGWDVKGIHRLIVTSRTYRQASDWRPEAFALDPRNQLLARQNRIRLDAEILRDAALSASGRFVPELGGPGVFPPQPDEVFSFTQAKRAWNTDEDGDRYRRGLYTFIWRQSQHPLLTTFDGPDAQTSCTKRNRSNTPLQALHLANDQVFFELAEGLAGRVRSADLKSDEERVDLAFALCMSRLPNEVERETLLGFLEDQQKQSPETAWLLLARTLMNLDEFVTRE